MRKDIFQRQSEIVDWINKNQSKAYICVQLNCKSETLNSALKKMRIEYKGNKGGRGIKGKYKRSVYEYLTRNGLFIQTSYLKKKLFKEGVKEKRCEKCQRVKWLKGNIPLEIHHKDGDRNNNELDNLEILCPNCHSLTDNNAGRGTIMFKEKQRKERFSIKKKERKKRVKKIYFCSCGSIKLRHSKKCIHCWNRDTNRRKVDNRPSKDVLIKEIESNGFSATGRKYGVSDNAIRKWIK